MFEEAICSYLQTHRFESLNLKAVLFDMDGVLFDSMKNHAAAWHEAMKRYNLQMTPEEAYLHEGRTGADTINNGKQKRQQKKLKKSTRQNPRFSILCPKQNVCRVHTNYYKK